MLHRLPSEIAALIFALVSPYDYINLSLTSRGYYGALRGEEAEKSQWGLIYDEVAFGMPVRTNLSAIARVRRALERGSVAFSKDLYPAVCVVYFAEVQKLKESLSTHDKVPWGVFIRAKRLFYEYNLRMMKHGAEEPETAFFEISRAFTLFPEGALIRHRTIVKMVAIAQTQLPITKGLLRFTARDFVRLVVVLISKIAAFLQPHSKDGFEHINHIYERRGKAPMAMYHAVITKILNMAFGSLQVEVDGRQGFQADPTLVFVKVNDWFFHIGANLDKTRVFSRNQALLMVRADVNRVNSRFLNPLQPAEIVTLAVGEPKQLNFRADFSADWTTMPSCTVLRLVLEKIIEDRDKLVETAFGEGPRNTATLCHSGTDISLFSGAEKVHRLADFVYGDQPRTPFRISDFELREHFSQFFMWLVSQERILHTHGYDEVHLKDSIVFSSRDNQ